ncbi:MAG: pantothenate kinase [Treponema sp.]|nr:pantothenate kinase [Treponema sp.]
MEVNAIPEGPKVIVGIDIGATTTKAVSIERGRLIRKVKIKASDAVAAATGAFGKMLLENTICIQDVQGIMITGVGSTRIKDDIFGIPTKCVDEIRAIGTGGKFLSGLDNIIITNIGTGTAIIEAGSAGISHYGGSGVGGGTIIGLAKKLLPTCEFSEIVKLAQKGNFKTVDLLLEDITDMEMGFLNKEATISNFGKMSDGACNADFALAIINMVYQVIGMLSVFAARAKNLDRVVITGNGSGNVVGQRLLAGITQMYGTEFVYPPDAEFTTAVGAGLAFRP